MHTLYQETTDPISLTLYSKCFHELNIAFKKPKQDTCHKCNLLNVKIKTTDGKSKLSLIKGMRSSTTCRRSINAKKNDKALSKENKVHTATVDINLTVHDLASDEVLAMRGMKVYQVEVGMRLLHAFTNTYLTCPITQRQYHFTRTPAVVKTRIAMLHSFCVMQ
ncbi:hypothetical protein PR048_004570 [Dryococelus australis]|uniref:Uncharacterized protein n=1 Tax=Dryococelus australis TaxID=614101 RepID=A0ABQ9I5T6_9NEOP|nr:hypothetical protein PR048_004570 [Dryococelus australis]